MIVRTAYQNTSLFHSDLFHQFEIFLARTDPACYLREFIILFHAFVDCVSVLFTIEEEFTLSDLSLRTTQTMKIII